MCQLLDKGVAAIFGPLTSPTSITVQSVCDAVEIPHIENRWDFQKRRNDLSINLYPRARIISRALADLVRTWDWKDFAILYEENEGAMRLADYFKYYFPNITLTADYKVSLYQFT